MVIRDLKHDEEIEFTPHMTQIFKVEGRRLVLLEQITDTRPVEDRLFEYRGKKDPDKTRKSQYNGGERK